MTIKTVEDAKVKTSGATTETVVPVNAVSEQKRAELQHDIQSARQRQEAIIRGLNDRKNMPGNLMVGMTKCDADIELIRRVAPECLEPWVRENRAQTDEERRLSRGVFHWGATHRSYLDTIENHKKNIALGWEPVMEHDGSPAMYGSCYLYRRPVEISRAYVESVEAMSDRIRSQEQASFTRDVRAEMPEAVHTDETTVTKSNMRPIPGFTLEGNN